MLLRLVQVNQGPSLSYKETAKDLEIWGATKLHKYFDETDFASNLGPLNLPKYERVIVPPLVPPALYEEDNKKVRWNHPLCTS